MGLGDYISWYQKKIGTYDKQLWERTVEQRILHGLTNVPKKTAKLKTELIDVDLVRGSSFSKAKPKHGLLTVTRLSILRLFLLPFYCQWWIQQTSPRVFSIFLLLYTLQLINMCLYISYCSTLSEEDSAEAFYNLKQLWGESAKYGRNVHCSPHILFWWQGQHVSASEVFVPGAMMMVLSWIHSQIVSTHSGPSFEVSSRKHRRKRIKRRLILPSRSRVLGSDSKSSQDTGSEKASCMGESSGNKYSKRPLVRRSSSTLQNRDVVWETPGRNPEPENEKGELESSRVQDANINSRQRVRLLEPREVINSEPRRDTPLDDDGFESLCGNCSSETGEAEELEVSNNQIISNNKVFGRASLNWKSAPIQNQIHNTDPLENLTQPLLSHAKVEVPLVQVTQHKDLLRLPEEGCASPDLECRRSPIAGSVEMLDEQLLKTGKASPSIASNSSVEDSKASVKMLWRIHRCNSPDPSHADSDTDASESHYKNKSQQRERLLVRRGGPQALQLPYAHQQTVQLRQGLVESSFNSSCESEDEAEPFTPGTPGSCPVLTEGTTSAGEWMGITTNSEGCSYSSELQSDSEQSNVRDSIEFNDHPFAWEFQLSSSMSLNPSCAASDRVSCTVWESRDVKKADLSVLDISSAIIARVEGMQENMDYFYVGVVMSVVIALLPSFCRLCDIYAGSENINVPNVPMTAMELSGSLLCNLSDSLVLLRNTALGTSYWERTLVIIALLERCVLSTLFFFLLAVAERTFKQRFLYAKLFSHLTSFRRARKSELPHFRLNKVRNIKTWLSVRSYLKKRGPQRSVDIIVSTAFLIALLLVSFLSVECLKDSTRLHSEYNVEALVWSMFLGVFLLRFMTLGTQINSKYRDLSVLITEQINLYLQIEQKPNKKEELMVANSVLKLAADLLKELESPFKISGLSANPYLYTITKVVILSALSGVLSEMLGFKLKLHKIKIK